MWQNCELRFYIELAERKKKDLSCCILICRREEFPEGRLETTGFLMVFESMNYHSATRVGNACSHCKLKNPVRNTVPRTRL